jgi:hypothetical protein
MKQPKVNVKDKELRSIRTAIENLTAEIERLQRFHVGITGRRHVWSGGGA